MTVVEFPDRKEPLVWLCNCGCSTHYAYQDGSIECASCGEFVNGMWDARDREEQEGVEPETKRFSSTVIPFDTDEAAMRDVLRTANKTTCMAVIIMDESGHTHCWGKDFETDEQKAWLDRQLARAKTALLA